MWRGDQPTTATTLSRDPDKRLTPSVRVAIDEVRGGGGTFPPCVARVLVDDGLHSCGPSACEIPTTLAKERRPLALYTTDSKPQQHARRLSAEGVSPDS